jgi:hypothetical protein
MATINPDLSGIVDGATADASDITTPLNTITNAINGNLDDDNIKTGANINHAKILGGIRASNRQDAATDNSVSNQRIVFGWSFVAGDNDDTTTKAITFPVTFTDATAPVVIVAGLGYKDSSNPAAITEGTASGLYNVTAQTITTTGFTAVIQSTDGTTMSTTRRLMFSWMAIGTLAN